MSQIIVLNEDYNQEDVNDIVMNYVLNSKYTEYYYGKGILLSSGNSSVCMALNAAEYFKATQRIFELGRNDKKLLHIILAVDDLNLRGMSIQWLLTKALDYFYSNGYQCVGAYHNRSKKREYYQHYHLVVNKVGLHMGKFQERNEDYNAFARHMRLCTGTSWSWMYKRAYEDHDMFSDLN